MTSCALPEALAPKLTTIRQKVVLDATPEEVYEAYVDPSKHSAFTGSPAKGEAKEGGRFTAWDGYIFGRFVELKKGETIVHEWLTTEWPSGYPPSLVELKLRNAGGKTELTMVHTKVPAEQADDYAEGWRDFYWEPLKLYFKGGSGKRTRRRR